MKSFASQMPRGPRGTHNIGSSQVRRKLVSKYPKGFVWKLGRRYC